MNDALRAWPEVETLAARFAERIREALGDGALGLYLGGSLAAGDFDPASSDIDFAVVLRDGPDDEIDAKRQSLLRSIHEPSAFPAPEWLDRLEGAYIPADIFRRHRKNDSACAQVNGVDWNFGSLGSEWILQRRILREQGLVVFGPDPAELIDPVGAHEIRQAVRGLLVEWWAPMLANPSRLRDDDYAAYAVLSMCRARHTLVDGDVFSKPVSARWALAKPDPAWRGLIAAAVAHRPNEPFGRFEATVDFIRETVASASL